MAVEIQKLVICLVGSWWACGDVKATSFFPY